MSMAAPPPRTRTMSHMRRLPTQPGSSSTSGRGRTSFGGPGEQVTPRSALGPTNPRPRSSLSMIERPVSLGGRGPLEGSGSGMARPSPLSSSRPLPPGRSTSGGKRATGANSPVPFGESEVYSSDAPGPSEVLEGALRREVEEKEELMMRLAKRDDDIAQLEARLAALDVNMVQGEARLVELYADQERWEAERAALEKEIAKKTTVIDKLRIQLRELEKENRECTRRLTEQAAQFESERQAFYDNTTHLKSRIQTLTDQQREWKEQQREEEEQALKEEVAEAEAEVEADTEAAPADPETPAAESPAIPARRRTFHRRIQSSIDRGTSEPPEMTALKLELSTLSTSHGSLGQTVRTLQSQLADLERVNLSLQEENEAYTTLLREKTLSGQMNMLGRAGSRSASPTPSEGGQQPAEQVNEEEKEEAGTNSGLLSPGQSPPPRARTHSRAPRPNRGTSPARSTRSGKSAKSARRMTAEALAAESLAGLPVAGPGLDLAAELGRAESIRLEDDLQPNESEEAEAPKEDEAMKAMRAELDALKGEIKTLKEENKGLTLYASKIIDRIISQEGFEHILAVDYRKPKEEKPPVPAPAPRKSLFQRAASLSISGGAPPAISTRPPLKITTDTSVNEGGPDSPATPMGKREKRGISMDWSRLNPFGAKQPATPVEDVRTSGLKPLTLGKTPSVKEEPELVVGGRKLDNQEDEDDRIERERLHAEMKLMGIERTPNIHTPSATSFAAAGQALVDPVSRSSSSTPSLGGMVGWGKRPNSNPSQKQPAGGRVPTGELRAEHLELLSDDGHSLHSADFEVREVETRMAALAEKEKHLSAEMAKGKGGGFTEAPARGTRVRRRTNSTTGSARSTLFSAGRLSRDGSIGEEPEHE